MVEDEMAIEEEVGGLPTGAIAATAVAAGVIAFMIRRARRAEQERMQRPLDRAAMAWDRVRDSDVRGKTAAATRDFMMDRVLPEFKPIMLDLLKDVRGYVDQGFKRAEKAIKDL
jgi:hypothetical protein